MRKVVHIYFIHCSEHHRKNGNLHYTQKRDSLKCDVVFHDKLLCFLSVESHVDETDGM